jgi:hypothetical protein
LNTENQEAMMESTVKDMAVILRSTEVMADQFAKRVQERVGQPVPYDEILAAMEKMSAKSLSMEKVISKLQQKKK